MNQPTFNGMVVRYVVGFGAAMLLSVGSYFVVTGHWFETAALTMLVILLLGFVQLIIQLVCFLHLGVSGRSASRTVTFIFTGMMMLIIVIGSIWIMKNLDYRMGMSGESMNEYMQKQNKKGF